MDCGRRCVLGRRRFGKNPSEGSEPTQSTSWASILEAAGPVLRVNPRTLRQKQSAKGCGTQSHAASWPPASLLCTLFTSHFSGACRPGDAALDVSLPLQSGLALPPRVVVRLYRVSASGTYQCVPSL